MNPEILRNLQRIKFPGEQEKLAREAALCRDATPDAKLGMPLELIDLSEEISSASPHRARQVGLLDESERREHDLLRNFIRSHRARRDVEGEAPRGA